MYKFILISLFFLAFSQNIWAQSADKDVDVIHYHIKLDISDFQNKTIAGSCELRLKALSSMDSFTLQLEKLKVDSILYLGQNIAYRHIGQNLHIHWPNVFNTGSTDRQIEIFYQGKPIADATWGGFYFSGNYAFNLGVGFQSEPHNFGRVWYPCKDNFVDRSTYDFAITTASDKLAMCNGVFTGSTNLGNNKVLHQWKMEDEIPTYLVSVAVAPYVLNESTHKDIPIVLASEAKDSLNMALSFVHLPNAIDAYLKGYGPHSFNRIGFNSVPFNGGAMEHATNIAYPQGTLDGETTSETLYAHELAHHWWGNTVTCRTAEDMWINEGWARYSESLFLEETYGKDAYRDAISALHKSVLHSAHLRDRDTLSISGIGHNHTYGAHVYDKGSVVVHTLRGYMGSDAFFEACRSFMQEYKFQDVSSDDLKTHFQKYTNEDLEAFFDDWVYQKGFPHFDILEWTRSEKNDSFLVKVSIRQRLKFADKFYKNVPMELFVIGENRQSFTTELKLSGPNDVYQFMSAFDPKFMALDPNEKISDAITDRMTYLTSKDTFSMGDAMMDIIVKELKDSALLHVAHHWIGPDVWYRNETFPVLSKERYWTVDGQWAETDRMDAVIEYNGRRSGTNYAIGYLDVQLIGITEDSLRLYYRPHPTAYWQEYPDYSMETGSKFDRKGLIKIRNLQKGEYTLAMADYGLLSSPELAEKPAVNNLKVYPVPASEKLQLECKDATGSVLEIINSEGRVIYNDTINTADWKHELDISNWSNGVYYAGVITKGKAYQPKAFFVRR